MSYANRLFLKSTLTTKLINYKGQMKNELTPTCEFPRHFHIEIRCL